MVAEAGVVDLDPVAEVVLGLEAVEVRAPVAEVVLVPGVAAVQELALGLDREAERQVDLRASESRLAVGSALPGSDWGPVLPARQDRW